MVGRAHSVSGLPEHLVNHIVSVANPLDLTGDGMSRAGHILDEFKKRIPEFLRVLPNIVHLRLKLVTFLRYLFIAFEMLFEYLTGFGHLNEVVLHLLIILHIGSFGCRV